MTIEGKCASASRMGLRTPHADSGISDVDHRVNRSGEALPRRNQARSRRNIQWMDQIREFLDERARPRISGICLFCGCTFTDRGGRTDDHVPSKVLLRKPYPPNLSTVDACQKCNNGFSADEQYVRTFLSCVLAGSTEPDHQSDPKAGKALARSLRLRAQMERARCEPPLPSAPVLWKPDSDRFNNVLIKNARGHLWFECAEVRFDRPEIWFAALEVLSPERRRTFEAPQSDLLRPEVGSRGFVRALTSQDEVDGWTVVQDNVYRFAVDLWRGETVRVRIVLAEYLAAEVTWPSDARTDWTRAGYTRNGVMTILD